MAIIVPYYGIHWDNKRVAYLMQGRGGTNAIGLKERAPFQVHLPKGLKHCNHQIPLANPVPNDYHWDYFLELLRDPLVSAMLPIPKERGERGVYYLVDDTPRGESTAVLVMLAKMASPIYNPVMPIWTKTAEEILTELQQTNVQFLVLTGVEPKHSEMIARIAKAAAHLPRKLMLVGASDVVVPPGVERVTTELLDPSKYDPFDLIALPWESLGAVVVKKYMRDEWPPVANPGGSNDGRPKASSATPPKPRAASGPGRAARVPHASSTVG